MKKVEYSVLCHRLEGDIDEVVHMLKKSTDPMVQRATYLLVEALRETEEEIIKDHEQDHGKVIRFPCPSRSTEKQAK